MKAKRNNRGRPRTLPGDIETVHCRLPRADHDWLRWVAATERTSVAGALRLVVERARKSGAKVS